MIDILATIVSYGLLVFYFCLQFWVLVILRDERIKDLGGHISFLIALMPQNTHRKLAIDTKNPKERLEIKYLAFQYGMCHGIVITFVASLYIALEVYG